jgi:hypothetical protein
MYYSERFLGRVAKLRKEHREAPESEQVELVREAFTGLIRSIPQRMVEEVFDQFTERLLSRAEDDRIFIDRAEYLADVADLLAGQYDTEHDPLHPEDWRLVSEIVNDYAMDLEMNQLSYIMQLVVEHHGA